MLVEKYGWAIQKSLFAETNQDFTFSHTRENSKMFNITSEYFSFFNIAPPANWVAHITRDFLTCYSCSYYSYLVKISFSKMQFLDFFPFTLIATIISLLFSHFGLRPKISDKI